jgi:hypothetical protein
VGFFETAPEKRGFSERLHFQALLARENGGTSLCRTGTLDFM